MEFEPMLTPREKSPLPENFPRGGSNPQGCGQWAQTLPTSYSGPRAKSKVLCCQAMRKTSSVIDSVQAKSSVRLMPQIQPSGRGLLLSPTAWSPDQHLAAMLAAAWYILGRTEGHGLGFGQLVCTHTGKCLKCQSSSDGQSDHSALYEGRR